MSRIRGESDASLEAVRQAMAAHEKQHPRAETVVYRQSPASIRIRIIDPDFAGASKAERHDAVWRILDSLPDEIQGEISFVLLLTPDEAGKSFANYDFEHPAPFPVPGAIDDTSLR